MKTALSKAGSYAALVAMTLSSACGGGDGGGGTPPITVASVVITSPAAATSFQTLGRTRQFSAQPRDAAGGNVTATVTWSSSNQAVASVNGAGLVTAVANGTAGITATAGGQQSTALQVTVAQVPAAVTGVPATVAFGALGSTRQLTGAVADSGGDAVAGAGAPVFSRAGAGASATVSAAGLVTATGVGIGDTVLATAGSVVVRAPIVVTQVVNAVAVTSTSGVPDTLFTANRTRQFTATARDSNNNVIAAPTFAWTSSVTGVATVGAATGLVTAGTTDGSTNIQASAGGVNGVRAMAVRRYPETFTITPPTANITTAGGIQLFNGTATDSLGSALAITWSSKNSSVVSVSPLTGTSTTATATGNGATHVVIAAGTRRDSSAVTVTNQPALPTSGGVNIGDDFFRNLANNTQPAVDTIGVGGTITWTWAGAGAVSHSVQSTGAPTFTSSTTKAAGTYLFTFNAVGTYTYNCAVHGNIMTGTVVVR